LHRPSEPARLTRRYQSEACPMGECHGKVRAMGNAHPLRLGAIPAFRPKCPVVEIISTAAPTKKLHAVISSKCPRSAAPSRNMCNGAPAELCTVCRRMATSTLPRERLCPNVMKTDRDVLIAKNAQTGAELQPWRRNNGRCHPDHSTPRTKEAREGPYIDCIRGRAKPRQPGSSPSGPTSNEGRK